MDVDYDAATLDACRTDEWPPELATLFKKVHRNIAEQPEEAKFRKLKLTNAKIAPFWSLPASRRAFEALGWLQVDGGTAIELPASANLALLRAAIAEAPPPPLAGGDAGELWSVTVLKGPMRHKLELPGNQATLAALALAIEQCTKLGSMPRGRQQLLTGYPPKLLEAPASASLAALGVKSVMLEDAWELLMTDLRATRATFAQLAAAMGRPTLSALVLGDYRSFIIDRAKAMLLARADHAPWHEIRAARLCFRDLWPASDVATQPEREAFCLECVASICKPPPPPPRQDEVLVGGDGGALEVEEPEGPRTSLTVDRADLFWSAVSQANALPPAELRLQLKVRFVGEAAEDAGGPTREFFNEFGRAAAAAEGIWQTTSASSLSPSPISVCRRRWPDPAVAEAAYRGSGRIFGLALCQSVLASLPPPPEPVRRSAVAGLAELLEATAPRPEAKPHQPLLLGLPLSRAFVRLVQGDDLASASVEELQAELAAEQHQDSPDFRASPKFLAASLADLGLEGQLTFSHQYRDGEIIDLVPGGRDMVVTDATKREWLRTLLRYELVASVEDAANTFRQGVMDVLGTGCAHLALLSASELREAWSGRGTVTDEDLATWRAKTEVSPAVKTQAAWLWDLLSGPDGELRDARARVLKFATGSDRWPVDSSSFTFSIEPMDGGDDKLPCSMTCGNMLQLPRYTRKEPLRDRLLQAVDLGLDLQAL